MKTLAAYLRQVIASAPLVSLTVLSHAQGTGTRKPLLEDLLASKVDKLFAHWDKPDSPGCSVGISKNGVPIHEYGYGMANLELRVPITPASVFHVASVSKQFTAMSILLLAQRGKLSFDDNVEKYVPGWADKGNTVTIRHLLTQTSGLRDGFTLQALAPPREDGTDINDAIANTLAHTRGVNFKPGSEFQYNNSNYVLLANLVKRISGQSLRAFTDANIFKPLGMTHTHVHDDVTMIIPNRTYGYHRGEDGFHVAPHSDQGHLVGTTGLFTTPHDLLLWEQNFAGMRVGDPVLIKTMQTPVISTGWWDKSSYGLGLEIGQHRGLRTIGHGGGDPGYEAQVVRYPDQGFAVAVLCNVDNPAPDVGELTRSIADIYLAGAFTEPAATKPAPTPVALSPEQLAGKAGIYYDPVSESVGQISLRDGKLMAREGIGEGGESIELIPITAQRFVAAGTTIELEFVPGASGRPQQVRQTGVGPKPIISQQIASFTLSSVELREFAGNYTTTEVDGTYTLVVRDSGLVMQLSGRSDMVLRPAFRDAFAAPVLGLLNFSRDSDGRVTGFTAYASAIKGMRFERKR